MRNTRGVYQVAPDRKPKDQTQSERKAKLMLKYGDLIERSALYLEVSRTMEAAAFRVRERDEFRKTIAAMKKSVEIPCGNGDFQPLLVSACVAEYGLGYSCWQRHVFEAATGLVLIPETDDPMQID